MAYSPGDRAAILSQLTGLTERIEATERAARQVETLGARLDALDGLPAQFQQLLNIVQGPPEEPDGETGDDPEASGRPPKPISPIWWPALTDDEYAELRPALRDWLGNVLAARYTADARCLSWCWERHPAAVDALTNLWQSWQVAYFGPHADVASVSYWQTRLRPDLIGIVAEDLKTCRMKSTGGQREHVDPEDLDTNLLASFRAVQDRVQ